jgi:hypothetical protein
MWRNLNLNLNLTLRRKKSKYQSCCKFITVRTYLVPSHVISVR